MVKTTFVMLMLVGAVAGPVLAQTPPTAQPRQAPAPIAPIAPIAPDRWADLAEAMEKGAREFEKGMQALEKELHSEEFKQRLQVELALQFPVPPVPPSAPRIPREQGRDRTREQQRRRVPEGWVESTEPFSRAFKVGRSSALMVANIAGNIQVSPGSSDQVEVRALKHAWGPDLEQAKQRLGDAVIEAYATGNRVEVRVDQASRRDGRGIEVEFDVKVPTDASVELRTVSGDIRVTNVKGEIRVQGISGNLSLDGTPRLAMVKTISGGITLANAGAAAQLSISTVSGDLLVETLSAPSLDLNTISGDVRISGWSGERALIRALDGDLNLQTSLAKGGRYEIESHSGNIQVALPEQPGFELDAQTFSGRIRVDFPVKSEGPIRDSGRGPRSIRGTYGDGSSSLRVQTFSGDLTVTRR